MDLTRALADLRQGADMYLKSLIEPSICLPPDGIIRHGFGEPSSYRGDYEQLAFEPAKNPRSKMLENAKAAVGARSKGYKGGEFSMGGIRFATC